MKKLYNCLIVYQNKKSLRGFRYEFEDSAFFKGVLLSIDDPSKVKNAFKVSTKDLIKFRNEDEMDSYFDNNPDFNSLFIYKEDGLYCRKTGTPKQLLLVEFNVTEVPEDLSVVEEKVNEVEELKALFEEFKRAYIKDQKLNLHVNVLFLVLLIIFFVVSFFF